MVRLAADLLNVPKHFYAEVPYVQNQPRQLAAKTGKMKASLHPVSPEGLAAWLEASRAYASQIATEFGSIERMEKRITSYWKERKGVRLWE